MATTTPPTRTRGRQISATTAMGATARVTATSKDSRRPEWPRSSARAHSTRRLDRPRRTPDLLDERALLPYRLHRHDLQAGQSQREHDRGKSSSGAHVDQVTRLVDLRHREQRERIEKVQVFDAERIADRGDVHGRREKEVAEAAELRDRLVGHSIGDVRGRLLKIHASHTGRRIGLCNMPPMQVHHEHGHIRGRHAGDPRSLTKRARSESAELVSGLHRDALQPLIVERRGGSRWSPLPDAGRSRPPDAGCSHRTARGRRVARSPAAATRSDALAPAGSSMRSRSAKVT